MTITIPTSTREWISGLLLKCTMVEWDRFTVADDANNDGELIINVYGWIERDEDEYKDFVHAVFWTSGKQVSYTTSSDEYSEELYCLLIGEDLEEHNECRRVEDTFDVPNAIELHEQKTLTDGGEDLEDLSTHDLVGRALEDLDAQERKDGIPRDHVVEWVTSRTELVSHDVHDAIEWLHNNGHVYEPREGRLRQTKPDDSRWSA